MTQDDLSSYAVTLLRVSLGVMYLVHSIVLKLWTFGLAGTADYFESIGLPGWLAYVTFAAEAVGGGRGTDIEKVDIGSAGPRLRGMNESVGSWVLRWGRRTRPTKRAVGARRARCATNRM
jgi:hypothetical protein